MSAKERKEKLAEAMRRLRRAEAERDAILTVALDLSTRLRELQGTGDAHQERKPVKPCPTCNSEVVVEANHGLYWCTNCGTTATAAVWNDRPREERLQRRVNDLTKLAKTAIGSDWVIPDDEHLPGSYETVIVTGEDGLLYVAELRRTGKGVYPDAYRWEIDGKLLPFSFVTRYLGIEWGDIEDPGGYADA